jgi:UDP-GlcNAc:undecaprenyl-phosphate GlcNAc-1-phosphate transferase
VTLLVALCAALAAYAAARLVVAPEPLRRGNFRGSVVSLVAGPVAIGVLVVGGLASAPFVVAVLLSGVAGLYDDLHGDASARGLGGHLRALLHGSVTTGAVKVLVVGFAGVVAALLLSGASWRAAADAALIAGLANLLNLFDLRPGRALKVALVVTLPVVTPLAYLVAGTAVGLLPGDLRERTMLGDAGANALGAGAGVALASRLPAWAAVVAVLAVVALTLASERVSFSAVIERVAALRWADRLGRTA